MLNSKSLKRLILDQGFSPLVTNQEGALRGGFALLSSGAVNNCNCVDVSNNCQCNGNNCGCPPTTDPNNCICGGPNNCNCYSTILPPPTSAPTIAVTVAPNVSNIAGYWPGIL